MLWIKSVRQLPTHLYTPSLRLSNRIPGKKNESKSSLPHLKATKNDHSEPSEETENEVTKCFTDETVKSESFVSSKDLFQELFDSKSKPKPRSSRVFQPRADGLTSLRTSDMKLFTETTTPVKVRHSHEPRLPSKCPVFDAVEDLELSLKCSARPANQFDEWLQWTTEGKMWRFPIDNEQDSPECDVPFHEHVFLDAHVDKELNRSRPLSMYMELVCSGLANNPHISVEQKREHLKWYASYFREKIAQIDACVEEERLSNEAEKQ